MDKFDLVYKKYKDLPINRTIFMSLIVTVLREKKMHTLDSSISEDIIFMNEMDKEITIYLKNQIEYYNDIDSEIYLIEKYKYVFLLPKINEITFSNVEKEKIIIDALKEYKGQTIFSEHLVIYIKQKYLNNKENKQKVNLKKLRKILLSQEEILEEKENIDVLYKYFIDIEDLNIVMELGSTTSIKSAIMGGLGISTISKWAIQDLVKSGKVKILNIEGLTLKRNFHIILNKEKFQSEATGKFLDFLDVDNINQILEL